MTQFQLYEQYYQHQSVIFELVKSCFKREVAFLSKHTPERSTRLLQLHSDKDFQIVYHKILNIHEFKTLYNMYYSLAKFKTGIPDQPIRLKQRNNEPWNSTYYNYITEYDFVLDIDADTFKNVKYAHQDAINIHEFFNSIKVPHEVRFSGKGFHFIIPHSYFLPQDLTFNPYLIKKCWTELYLDLAKLLEHKFTEFIDLSIYDLRRVLKIPYSLAVYPETEKMFICWPFHSTEELENFSMDKYTLTEHNIHKLTKIIKKRGTFLFNKDGEVLKNGFGL